MRQALIRWLLRLLAKQETFLPELRIYALVTPGESVAEVTTNLYRARALAIELSAKKQTKIRILRCVPVAEEPYR